MNAQHAVPGSKLSQLWFEIVSCMTDNDPGQRERPFPERAQTIQRQNSVFKHLELARYTTGTLGAFAVHM